MPFPTVLMKLLYIPQEPVIVLEAPVLGASGRLEGFW